MDKRKLIIIISGIAIVVFSFFSMKWLGSFKKNPDKKPIKEIIKYVKAEKVEYENKSVSIEAMGRVTSQKEITLISEVRGKILRGDVQFKVGEVFNKGDLIVKFDDSIELYNMKSRKSSFLNAVAGMLPDLRETLPSDYNEWNQFLNKINIDKNLPDLPEINSTQERIFMASRNILTNYYSIKSAEANFRSYKIYAPFTGTITEVYFEEGTVANPGAKLGKIINTLNLELETPVVIEDAKWIRIGKKVKVFDEGENQRWTGRVIRKSQNINPATQSINIYVALKSTPQNPLYKGEYLSAQFTGIRLKNVMEIPRNAVFNGNMVFVVKNGLLEKEEINIVKIIKDKLFFNGLKKGLYVVAEPLVNATENTKVKILGNK
jgi:multidrug efflux pump subunit AcrA (membrane-fusion protein)